MSTTPQVNDESSPLSSDDQPFYDALKNEYGDACTDDFYIRVARAFRNNKKTRLQQTLDEAKRVIEWRAQMNADTILTRELDQCKLFHEYWPGMMYGEDSEGHLIAVDRISEINLEGFQKEFNSVDKLLPHRLQYMERIQWEKVAISKRLGRRVYKHICIVDLKGLGMKHASRAVINYLKPIFDVGQLYYPETLHRLYLINAPMIFAGVWKMISHMIDAETRDKIQVLKDSDKCLQILESHGIPIESIPTFMGGQHPGRPMNSTFKPSVPDTPLPVPDHAVTGAASVSDGPVVAQVVS